MTGKEEEYEQKVDCCKTPKKQSFFEFTLDFRIPGTY